MCRADRVLIAASLALLVALNAYADDPAAPIKVIIDTDPAISVPTGFDVDDDLAILFALASPELDVLGLTITYGNAPIYETYRDAVNLMRLAGATQIPVMRGAGWTSRDVHRSTDASRFLINTLMRSDGDITVVTIGPLTNLAAALTQQPEIERKIKRIVILGGTLHSRLPDLNIMAHPEATEIVFGSAVPKVMIPLDTCIQAAFKKEQLELVRKHPESVLYEFRHRLDLWVKLWSVLGRIVFRDWSRRKLGGFYPWDVVAMAYLVKPELLGDERCYTVHMKRGWLSAEPCSDTNDNRYRLTAFMRLDSRRFVDLMMERILSIERSSSPRVGSATHRKTRAPAARRRPN